MNVLIFAAREFNPVMGGIERVSSLLAPYLMEHGHQVYFLAAIKTSEMEYTPVVEQFFLPDGRFKGTKANKKYVLYLIEKLHISVIINQTDFGMLFKRSYLPKHVKIISVIHNSYKAIGLQKRGLYRKIRYRVALTFFLSRVGKISDRIVLFSDKFIPEFKHYCKTNVDDKIKIIPNFNTYDQVNMTVPKANEVLFVGRFCDDKRLERLINIWYQVESQYPLWKLTLVGDGEEFEALKQLTLHLKLNQVYFEGIQNPEPYYQRASIFCLTSSYESFGMVLTEAMQHKIPCIAFDSYVTASEIIDSGINGFLIKPFDLDTYAEKLSLLMNDEEKRNEMGENALKHVEKFSVSNVGKFWNDALSGLDFDSSEGKITIH